MANSFAPLNRHQIALDRYLTYSPPHEFTFAKRLLDEEQSLEKT